MAVSIEKQQQQRQIIEALLNSSSVTPEMIQEAIEALVATNANRSVLALLTDHLEKLAAGRAATFQPA